MIHHCLFSLESVAARLSSDFQSSLVSKDGTFGGYKVDNNCLQTLQTSDAVGLHLKTFLLSVLATMTGLML